MSNPRSADFNGRTIGPGRQGMSFRATKLILFLQGLFATAPLLLFSALYLLSLYAMVVTGHWPQPLFDDPKFIPGGLLYDLLYAATFLLFTPMLVSSLVMFPMLTAVMWR